MERNKRILNFSEFTKHFSKGGPKSAPGNDPKDVSLMIDAASKLDAPTVGDGSKEMDSVESKPASTKVKTDYEQTPQMPNGPNNYKKETEEEVTQDDDKEDGNSKKSNKFKSIKKTKDTSKKSAEQEREESGEY